MGERWCGIKVGEEEKVRVGDILSVPRAPPTPDASHRPSPSPEGGGGSIGRRGGGNGGNGGIGGVGGAGRRGRRPLRVSGGGKRKPEGGGRFWGECRLFVLMASPSSTIKDGPPSPQWEGKRKPERTRSGLGFVLEIIQSRCYSE